MENKIPETTVRIRRQHLAENVNTKIFTPREYQVEILDAARKKNVIACLGTGTGKTFIAVMLIKELAYEIRKDYDEGGKRTVFLAPTAPLVKQQKKVVEDYTDLRVGVYCGKLSKTETLLDFWNGELKKNQVLVMTPEIFRMIICHGIIPLAKVNLLVIDECHRAKKAHPYREVMRCFDSCPASEQPRILGLSASLLNNKCKPTRLEHEIHSLEKILRCAVETASDLVSLAQYGTKPTEKMVFYDSYSSDSEYYKSIVECLDVSLNFMKEMSIKQYFDKNKIPHPCKQPKRYLKELKSILDSLGPWCAQKTAILFEKEIGRMIDNTISEEHKRVLRLVCTELQKICTLCDDLMKSCNDCTSLVIIGAAPKLLRLLTILEKFRPKVEISCDNEEKKAIDNTKKNDHPEGDVRRTNGFSKERSKPLNHRHVVEDPKAMCGIVFVKERITAQILHLWFSEVCKIDSNYKFISSSFIFGHNHIQRNSVSKEFSMALRYQEETLQKFRSREYNLLIATSVVEEGLDVPKCNLVIRFDKPEEFRAYVQSKGRARAQDSQYIIMVPKSDRVKFVDEISDFQTIENILMKKCHGREIPSETEITEMAADELKEAYMPNKIDGAPRVQMSTAIALVNRYCVKLPSDTFTKLTPTWKLKRVPIEGSTTPGYQCIVRLPINSPMKNGIVGDVMPKAQLAKMAAALKTCRLLHKAGELDDNLLPTGKEVVKFEQELIKDLEEEITPQGAPRPGTTKRRQYYFKEVAEALKGDPPEAGISCFLYMFSMKLTCPIPEEQNTRGRKIHDPAETTHGFGLITTRRIPPICSFPVFTRSGEVTIRLEFIKGDTTFKREELEKLAFFHKYAFADVLRLEKYPMLFDPKEAKNSFCIIPIDKDSASGEYEISWKFVEIINNQKEVAAKKISEEERKYFVFETEQYMDAVVMPWYRNLDKPQFFYVAEICDNLTPKSDFPGAGYSTFEGYYENKYDIKIMNGMQPLLDVDHTSARLNLLTPRYVNRKGVTLPTSSEQTKKAKRENLQQKQILVPELCIIHPFPASLWRKAVCLPCILYRVNSLLLAEQLRLTVAREIGVGSVDLDPEFEWPMLDFGWTLADVLKARAAAEETEKKNLQNIRSPEQMSNSIQAVNPLDSFPIGTWSNDLSINKNNEFVIDTFDPEKVNILNDDDILADQEVSNIQFCSTGGNVDGFEVMWGSAGDGYRYGSPSNFEGTGWDSEWDIETENANFHALNLPGLGYISAPTAFNMEGLSSDLASCRDDMLDMDSMDEESMYDENEQVMPSITYPVNGFENAEQSKPEFNEELSLYQSEWLSVCDDSEADVVNNDDDDEGYSESKNYTLPELECLELNGSYDGDNTETSEINNEESQMQYDDLLEKEHYGDKFSNGLIESTLAFGDLLPDRENLQISDDNIFRVHFDENVDLDKHEGPSPSIILQAFTMSNANDGINLERLETVGDSFLKYAITAYLFCTYSNLHEGKLSYLRSKQISNLNLYRLGKRKGLGRLMIASKFEPNDNWLPPCYTVPKGLEQALIESGSPTGQWNIANLGEGLSNMNEEQIRQCVFEKKCSEINVNRTIPNEESTIPYIPYNLLTQHSIPDKSIADCVEALIGAYLISCGPKGALLFMSWLGLRVLPDALNQLNSKFAFDNLKPPPSPLFSDVLKKEQKLAKLLSGYESFEEKIGYSFNDRSYLIQAFTHASYHYNQLTDCYQRLEFLGDAVLDYLITRHLYEEPQKHSPGTLTDLRSALVNNTFFASLAVKYDFHKYFKAISPGLFVVINKFVELKSQNSAFEDCGAYYLEEEECEGAEEVEVPKALGDVFESVAGAIYLDSGMSLDTVWRVYYAMMKPEIEYFSTHVPKSPIRELLEMEPQTAKFDRAEMTMSGKVRVRAEVFGVDIPFYGIGRNKRIAKCTAAKRALRYLKKMNNTKTF